MDPLLGEIRAEVLRRATPRNLEVVRDWSKGRGGISEVRVEGLVAKDT